MSESIDITFSRLLLRQAVELVRAHCPGVKLREAWTYHFHGDHWEFHGPGGFYWHGGASNAYEARYKGWMEYLRDKGHDFETDL